MTFHVPGARRMTVKWCEVHGRPDLRCLASEAAAGNNGAFVIKRKGGGRYFCIVSDHEGWAHVSVSLRRGDLVSSKKCPSWADMCHIKTLFWDSDDCVVQYHPAAAEYRNFDEWTLHLWRPIDAQLPTPPTVMVGP